MHFIDGLFHNKNWSSSTKFACQKTVVWKIVNIALKIDAYFLDSSIPRESNLEHWQS